MPDYNAGSASVTISPNFDGFVRELREDLDRVDVSLAVDIKPDITGFGDQLKTELGRIDASLDVAIRPGSMAEFGRELDADLARVTASLDVRVLPDLDTAEFDARLAAYRPSISALITPDFNTVQGAIVDAQLERLARERIAPIIPALDSSQAAVVNALLDRLARDRVANINVSTTGGGLGNVSRNADNASRSLSAMSAIKFTGLTAGITALIPLLLGAVGAAGGLVAALGALGGVGAIGGSGIIGAFSAMKSATEGAGKAAEQNAQDLDQVTDAQQRVVDAQHNEMDSLQRVEDAQKSLTQARIDAKDAMDNLNLAVKNGDLSEKGAELSYRRAVVNLAKVRQQAAQGKATTLDVETAQQEVDTAGQNITNVKVKNQQTRAKADDANSKGVEGSDQVQGAQRQLEQAQYGVQQAQIQTAQAVRELAKAQADAAKSASEAAGGTDKFAQAMAKLAPSAQEFVRAMQALGPQWTDLRKAVQENLFAGLGDSMTTLANNQLPALKSGLSQIASGMNAGIKDTLSSLDGLFTELVSNGTMQQFIDGINAAMSGMAPFITGLTSAFIQLGATVGPSLGPLFTSLGATLDQIAGPLGKLGASFIDTLVSIMPTLTTLINALADGLQPVLPVIGRLLNSIGQALIPLIPPFSQIAQVVGNALVTAINAIAPSLPVIAQAFADVLVAVAPLVEPLAQIFATIATAVAGNISALAKALAPVVVQLAEGLAPVVPVLANAFQQLMPVFAQMAQTIGTALVSALEKIIPVLPDLITSWSNLMIALVPLLPVLVDLAVQILPVLADILVRLAPLMVDLLNKFTDLVNYVVPILVPAMEKWKDTMVQAWDRIKGAWDAMKLGLDQLRDKFTSVIETIKTAWNELTEIFKSGGLGGIAGKVVDKALELLPGHATGGLIEGDGTGTSDSILARVSNGEFVVRAAAARQHLPLLESINSGALPAFAEGGLVGAKTEADATQAKVAMQQLLDASKKAEAAGDIEGARKYANDAQTIANRLGAAGAPTSAGTAPTGGVKGAGSPIVDSMAKVVAEKFPMMTLTSGLRNTDNGYHTQGKAADFSNGSDDTPEMQALASFIATNYPQSLELIHSPFGHNLKNGKDVGDGLGVYGAGTMSEHRNHVHWAVGSAISAPSAPSAATPASPQAAADPSNYSGDTYIGPSSVDASKDVQEATKDGLPEDYSLQGIFSKAGGILATGLLSAFGLENSVLSNTNTYNKAATTTIDYYSKQAQTASADPGTPSAAATPETPRDTPAAPTAPTKHAYDPKGGSEQWRSTVIGVLQGTGRDLGLADRTLSQIRIESGGNPTAQNNTDINAKNGVPSIGLLQVIKPTFDANLDPRFPGGQKDPEANIAAAFNYVDKRYKGAAKIWPTTAGYAAGGWVSGDGNGTSDDIPARLSHGEFVVNAAAASANGNLLQAINSGTLRAPALPAGLGARGGDTRNISRDHSVNFGDVHVMNPDALVQAQDRWATNQAMGALAQYS